MANMLSNMTRALLFLNTFLAASVPAPLDACGPTIPELLKLPRPNPVERYITAELVAVPLADIVARSELVVEGNLEPVRTFLTDDECYLYTEYKITAPRILMGALRLPERPGPQNIFVRVLGGTTVIDGVNVVVQHQQLPLFKSTQRVILFLSPLANGPSYTIVGHGFGVFEVAADGNVHPLPAVAAAQHYVTSMSKAAFLEELNRLKRK